MPKDIKKEAEILYDKVIQTYNDNPKTLMGEAIERCLSKYNDKEAKELNSLIMGIISASMRAGFDDDYKLSDFEIDTSKLYEEFLSSNSIEALQLSIRKLKSKIDYFKQRGREENLVIPIRDFEMLNIELNALKYGLSHWIEIKKYIASSSNKQVDIQKGLLLNKQDLSTFFYMMDKLGFIKKETLNNRVYIKIIKDNKIQK